MIVYYINMDINLPSNAMTWLSPRGYGIRIEDKEYVTQLRKRLTVTPVSNSSFKKEMPSFTLYKKSLQDPDVTFVPKYYGLQNFGCPSTYQPSKGKSACLKFKGGLRPSQHEPVEKILEACNDPKRSGGIINIQCGGGKTVLGIYAACALGRKTLIIAHKDFLLNQWRERIEEFAPGTRIGLIKGKKCDIEGADIVLASIQCMSMKDYEENMLRDFGTLIIDEVHRSGTEVFSRALMCCTPQYSIGLSATVERKDAMEHAFKWFIGDIVYSHKEHADNVTVIKSVFNSEEKPYSDVIEISTGTPNMSRMINNITACEERNKWICDLMLGIPDLKERKILVLSDRRAHLRELSNLLGLRGLECGFYMGGMKQEELEESSKKKVVLATFSFASEGFDLPSLNTLFLVSPKSSVEQSVGRILRDRSTKVYPIIYDICDHFSLFYALGKKRGKFYKEAGYHMVTSLFKKDEPI
jgi:superfamily II DNA or RNA helicase